MIPNRNVHHSGSLSVGLWKPSKANGRTERGRAEKYTGDPRVLGFCVSCTKGGCWEGGYLLFTPLFGTSLSVWLVLSRDDPFA